MVNTSDCMFSEDNFFYFTILKYPFTIINFLRIWYNNKALQIYNKYYKRYHARLKVKQIKEPDFYSWKYKTLIMRADCEDGNVTPEEYEAWNEEYFPNRTKK